MISDYFTDMTRTRATPQSELSNSQRPVGMESVATRRRTPRCLAVYPNSAPRMPMTLRKMMIPTITTAIKRKIRNQKHPL
jgi:hypothetical protein